MALKRAWIMLEKRGMAQRHAKRGWGTHYQGILKALQASTMPHHRTYINKEPLLCKNEIKRKYISLSLNIINIDASTCIHFDKNDQGSIPYTEHKYVE